MEEKTKYEIFLETKIKTFDYANASIDEVKKLISETDLLEQELNNEKIKSETNLENLNTEINSLLNDLNKTYPTLTLENLDSVSELINSEITSLQSII